MIATFPSLKLDIDNYPAIKKYLFGFKPKLRQTGQQLTDQEITSVQLHAEENGIELQPNSIIKSRKRTTNKWFETQDSIDYWEDFSMPKIIYGEIVKEPQFYLDKGGEFYVEATAFIMTGENLEYLYYLLHSKSVTYFFKSFYAGGGLGEAGYRYKKAFLENLPVPKPKGKINLNERNFDEEVYKLYQLTKEEIAFIERQ